MTTPLPVTAGAAVWWTSPQFKGLLATFVISLLAIAAHWIPKLSSISYDQVFGWIGDITEVLVAGGALLALIQRALSKGNPLTLTTQGAANHPSTIAVVETQAAMKQAGIPTAVELQKTLTSIKPDPPDSSLDQTPEVP
jgi:hypothetical protein